MEPAFQVIIINPWALIGASIFVSVVLAACADEKEG
jgi:preprotein translocase subunit Sec61beta